MRSLSLTIAQQPVLDDLTFDLLEGEVLCLVGNGDCGCNALMRSLNRTREEDYWTHQTGQILLGGRDIMDRAWDLPDIRRRVALVPQVANPFPSSIWENIAYAPRLHRLVKTEAELATHVQTALERAGIWSDIQSCLHDVPAHRLPPVTQRLVCIARALAVGPDVLILDEPSTGLGGLEPEMVRDLTCRLKADMPILLSTPSLKVAAAASDRIAHMKQGRLLEVDGAEQILTNAQNDMTRAFVEAYC